MSSDTLSAAEAARALGVTRPTLYAYVSRGLIRSQPGPGSSRARRYPRDDVERLRLRAEERRDPDKVAAHALQWGVPVLASSITLITGDALYYRGLNVVELAREATVEEVASLIWTGSRDAARPPRAVHPGPLGSRSSRGAFVPRAQAALALASATDAQAFDLRPEAVVRSAWRILDLLVGVAARRARADRIDAALARGWRVHARAQDVIRAALILMADHELNVSAFTARCIASAGSQPYAVVGGGLAAIEGVKHGGSTSRAESLLAMLRRSRSLHSALALRVRQGLRIEGFGHPLYPRGDPRSAALLALLGEHFQRSRELRFVREFARAGTSLTGDAPNVDFALAAVSRVLGLPPDSGLTLFAIGRSIGWLGHAIEQYALDQIIRPRARYTGVPPNGAPAISPA
ncbi:MAG TPA: citrate synthase family protein [Gemmatimonadaceae bacterium]|nr:citrate synthase family protein [Gemmatimonadaceae bacterium]